MNDLTKETPAGNQEIDPWSNQIAIVKEITDNRVPVDYIQIIADNRVVLLGETHENSPIRDHLARMATAFRNAGITHYAIEASSTGRTTFDRLNAGEQVDLSQVQVGPFVPSEGRSNYETTIKAMSAQGIKIVPVDIDQSTKPTTEERESHIMQELRQVLTDPNAKVAVLLGGFHVSKKVPRSGIPYVGRRLTEAGIPTVTVRFAGGFETTPKIITDGVRGARLADQEFMLDMKPYKESKYAPYGEGETDFVIHLPQQALRSSHFGRF